MVREKRQFSFLLPAVLTVALVFHMLPHTQAVLREIPERLALVAETKAKEPVKRKTPDKGNAETLIPAATGNYEDGVYTGSSNGYDGEITVQVTVENGQIADILILSAPGETEPYFSLARSVLDTVKQSQTWEVDTVSGATYSSRGILGAIQNAITGEEVENEEPPSVEPVGTKSQDSFKDPAAYKDGTYYGTASGFGGSIKVEVVIKKGKIAEIRVISASGETGDYLSRAKGVISRILGKGSPNVDSVSGATYSSTGIINAVKRALSKAATDGKKKDDLEIKPVTPVKPKPKPKPDPEPENPDEPAEYVDGVYIGTADGFGGEIQVEVTVEDGKIAKITVQSALDETPEYLNKAIGVITGILEKGSPDVDTISGATYSSTGIINAVKQALLQAVKTPEEGGEGGFGEGEEGGSGEGDKQGGENGGGETSGIRYEDGTYTGSGWCDDGEDFYYEINISIRVEGGRITDVSVSKGEDESESPEDNDFYLNWAVSGRTRSGAFYPGIPAQVVSSQNADVDTISGATYSSETIKGIAARIISGIPVVETKEEEPGTGETSAGDDPAVPGDETAAPDDNPAQPGASGQEGGDPVGGDETSDGEIPSDDEEPAGGDEPTVDESTESEEAPDDEESAGGDEAMDGVETADVEEPSDDEEPARGEEPGTGEDLSDGDEPADSEETADKEEPRGSEEAAGKGDGSENDSSGKRDTANADGVQKDTGDESGR